MSDIRYVKGNNSTFVIQGDMEKAVEFVKDEFYLMSGQEFYDRFEKEYVKMEGQPGGGTIMPRSNALIAAKKAAGLEKMTVSEVIEKQLVNVFKLGMLDALGSRTKPNPMPAIKEAQKNIEKLFVESGGKL